jgi:hypothetical protein
MAVPAGWHEQSVEPLGGGRPEPDQRTVIGPDGPGLESMLFVQADQAEGPLDELAADELRWVGGSSLYSDVDGPRLRTVAGAEAAVLDLVVGQGPTRTAERRVLILHRGRLFQLHLHTSLAAAEASRRALEQMLASWHWTG